MTPSQILALVRDLAFVAGIGIMGWLLFRSGKDHAAADALKALQAQITAQSQILDTWHKASTDADEKLSAAMAKINAAAPIRHDWVRPPTCGERPVLPPTAREAGQANPLAGSVRPGNGSDAEADRRDQVIALYKQRWKTVLAECQSVLDQWPSP